MVTPHTAAMLAKKFEGRVMVTLFGQEAEPVVMVVAVVKVNVAAEFVLPATR